MKVVDDIFKDDDGQWNPVKMIGVPSLVSLSASVCAAAWQDPLLWLHAPYYFGAITGGLVAFAGAVWGHAKAQK